MTKDKRKRVTLVAVDEFREEWTFEVDRLTMAEWTETAPLGDAAVVEALNLKLLAGDVRDQPADVVAKCLVAASRFFRGAPQAPKTT